MSTTYPSILDELGLGPPVRMVSVGGGCIADARVATFADGTRVFVKCAAASAGLFECEAQGLAALAETGAIRVPRVVAVNREALVLEFIRSAPKKPGFTRTFGRSLASLHQHRGKTFGFPHDNFIGSTPQCNEPLTGSWTEAGSDNGSAWPAFFMQRRLRFQVNLALNNGFGQELQRLLDRSEARMLEILDGSVEPAVLLHGDLWGGNYIVDERGEACLIDPAVYYGHREADLAMTHLFGGFEPSFYTAYGEVAPLDYGHQERLPIYQLYHVLNHLNLFGGGYLGQSRRILNRYAS